MTQLFTDDGHLTEEALKKLIQGELNQDQRLEVGEHLSFCDSCLERYTALLTEDTLEVPAIDSVRPVMRRVRTRRWSDTVRRIGSAVAAAAITCMLWYGGVFDAMGNMMTEAADCQGERWYDTVSSSIRDAAGALSQEIMDAASWGVRIPD